MDIFESLENLEVSEACFNDILETVQEIINKKYPKGTREHGILSIKAQNSRLRDYYEMDKRGPKNARFSSQDRAYGADTKNALGSTKTNMRRKALQN